MAYLDVAANEAAWLAGRPAARAIRLGETERQVILRARRDAQAGRAGQRIGDPRLEALRLYAMLGRYRDDAAAPLRAAGFSTAERRIVDAMLDALPMRRAKARPATGRLIIAALILAPLLAAIGAYSWASFYIQDQLIALVLSGLALLLIMPLAGSAASPARHPAY